MRFNVYCDESCHIEHDNERVMILGSIWCPEDSVTKINKRIRELKLHHQISPYAEIKWTKVSPSKKALYLDLIDYFFDVENLNFRGIIIPDKSKLNHTAFHQDHDAWYYKMYFQLINTILNNEGSFSIYLDVKDTKSGHRVQKLHEVICNSRYDFNKDIVKKVQTVHSHEIQILQLADLIIGAVAYANRELNTSQTKLEIIQLIKKRSQISLTNSTLYGEKKFNLLKWKSKYDLS